MNRILSRAIVCAAIILALKLLTSCQSTKDDSWDAFQSHQSATEEFYEVIYSGDVDRIEEYFKANQAIYGH